MEKSKYYFILITFFLISTFQFTTNTLFAQILLLNDYKCILSEIPFRGWGLENKNIVFYQEAMREEEPAYYVKNNNYKVTKDKIYYKTGLEGDTYFYEIFLPETSTRISLSSNKESYELFCAYSTQLMAAVRKHRKFGTDYFKRKNGGICTPNIDTF